MDIFFGWVGGWEGGELKQDLLADPLRACLICCICFEPTLSAFTIKHFGYSSRSCCKKTIPEFQKQGRGACEDNSHSSMKTYVVTHH